MAVDNLALADYSVVVAYLDAVVPLTLVESLELKLQVTKLLLKSKTCFHNCFKENSKELSSSVDCIV